MSRWFRDLWADWSDDNEAIVRGRGLQMPPEPPAVAADLAQVVAPRPEPLNPVERRARLAHLVARLEGDVGDSEAAEELRQLLG